jgi:hypothetical protein
MIVRDKHHAWTMLSEFIICNYGENASPREFLPLLVVSGYIGNSDEVCSYCDDMLNITSMMFLITMMVLRKTLRVQSCEKTLSCFKVWKRLISQLLHKQNAVKFVKTVGDDEKTGYLLYILDIADVGNPKKVFTWIFWPLKTIKKINKPTAKVV